MESIGTTAGNIGITKNPDNYVETAGPPVKPDIQQKVTTLGITGGSGGSDERYEGEDGERRGGGRSNVSPPLDNSGLAREIENNRVWHVKS